MSTRKTTKSKRKAPAKKTAARRRVKKEEDDYDLGPLFSGPALGANMRANEAEKMIGKLSRKTGKLEKSVADYGQLMRDAGARETALQGKVQAKKAKIQTAKDLLKRTTGQFDRAMTDLESHTHTPFVLRDYSSHDGLAKAGTLPVDYQQAKYEKRGNDKTEFWYAADEKTYGAEMLNKWKTGGAKEQFEHLQGKAQRMESLLDKYKTGGPIPQNTRRGTNLFKPGEEYYAMGTPEKPVGYPGKTQQAAKGGLTTVLNFDIKAIEAQYLGDLASYNAAVATGDPNKIKAAIKATTLAVPQYPSVIDFSTGAITVVGSPQKASASAATAASPMRLLSITGGPAKTGK